MVDAAHAGAGQQRVIGQSRQGGAMHAQVVTMVEHEVVPGQRCGGAIMLQPDSGQPWHPIRQAEQPGARAASTFHYGLPGARGHESSHQNRLKSGPVSGRKLAIDHLSAQQMACGYRVHARGGERQVMRCSVPYACVLRLDRYSSAAHILFLC